MNSSEQDNLLFLLSGSCNALPNSYDKLRSYLNIHSANVAEQLNLKLPKCFNNQNITCQYCYSPWSSATSSLKLLPAKKLTANQKKKIKDQDDTFRDEDEIREPSPSKNNLVLKCKVCGNKTSFFLKRKSKKTDVKPEVVEVEVIKKKKKKKEKSCGLKAKYIISKNETKPLLNTPINQNNKTSLNNSITIKNTPNLSIKKSIKSDTPVLSKNNSKIKPITKPVINPFAIQNRHKISKKNKEKLKQLSQAVKEDKGSIRNTLKDFLTLVSR